MKIETWEEPDHEKHKAKLEASAIGKNYKRWRASISGLFPPGEPFGRGDTEEEARSMAIEYLSAMYQEIGKFLQQHGARLV
jgi:hypothetical protein